MPNPNQTDADWTPGNTKAPKPGDWIGVDFDGTLAMHPPPNSEHSWTELGAPIPAMVRRVKAWLAEGRDVRIFTARANPLDTEDCREFYFAGLLALKAWCLEHLGQVLPLVCSKDYKMTELWDDRAVQVVVDTGLSVVEHLQAQLENPYGDDFNGGDPTFSDGGDFNANDYDAAGGALF